MGVPQDVLPAFLCLLPHPEAGGRRAFSSFPSGRWGVPVTRVTEEFLHLFVSVRTDRDGYCLSGFFLLFLRFSPAGLFKENVSVFLGGPFIRVSQEEVRGIPPSHSPLPIFALFFRAV